MQSRALSDSGAPVRWVALPAPGWIAVGAALLFTLLYLPALGSFFSNDDWVLLHHYGRIPLSRPWEFFSPKTIWFYRPLQSLQFGLFYRAFGFDPVPYNLALWAGHLGVCALLYRLVREVTERPWLAAGTTAAFAAQWIYADILFWKANFNTVQWALVTLGAAVAWARFLRSGERRWRRRAWTLCALAFFTKEAAVNLPLLLAWIWLAAPVGGKASRAQLAPRALPTLLRQAVPDLAVPVLLVLVYVALHRLLVEDVYSIVHPGYVFVGPAEGVRQLLFALNHALLAFHRDPIFLPQLPGLRAALEWGVTHGLFLPPLLALFAWRTRDRALLFGLGWLVLALVPCVFLESFHASRFYYLPAAGAALVHARLVERIGRFALEMPGGLPRVARVLLPAGVAYALLASVGTTWSLLREDARDAERARAVFALLRANRGAIPSGALIVLQNPPTTYFNGGLGVREMVRLALADESLEGVMDGQSLDPERLASARARRHVYVIDLAAPTLTLRPISPAGPARAAH